MSMSIPTASRSKVADLADRVLAAWNAQDVGAVLECYTPELKYRDPNTRGYLMGRVALRKYLTKLFAKWRMTWAHRESFSFAAETGRAVLWRATFQKPEGGPIVEADGMDLVILDGELIARNEVYFDRAVLAPFVGQ